MKPFSAAFFLRSALLVTLSVVLGFAGYITLLVPATKSVAAIDIASLPPGSRTFSKPLFFYGTEPNPPPTAAIMSDDTTKNNQFIRMQINNSPGTESYSGLTIYTQNTLPTNTTLLLRWRSMGHAPDLLIDVMDGSPPRQESSIGENFYAYTPLPPKNWTTTTIPFTTLARNSYQPAGAPNDGKFDTNGIRQVSITCFPGAQIILDLREVCFVWDTRKWHLALALAIVGLLGVLLLLRTTPKHALTPGSGNLHASAITSRIVFSLTAGAITLSIAQQGPDFLRYSTLSTYGAFLCFVWLDELVRTGLPQGQTWGLRYIVILVFGWYLGFAGGMIPLFLLLLASYMPALQHRSPMLFFSVPAIAFLGLIAKPPIDMHASVESGIMFILGTVVMATQIRAILDQRRAKLETKQATFLYEDLFNNTSDGIYTLNPEGIIETVNHGFERLLGYQADEIVGRNLLDFVHVDDRDPVKPPEQNKIPAGSRQYDVRFINKGGEIRAALVRETAIFKKETLVRYQVIATDITERRQVEEIIKSSLKEKEILLKEIHHRVKNNLQIISSLLNLQSKYFKDKPAIEMFKESQNRVKLMALIHEKLYQSKDLARIDFAEYTRSLVNYLFRSYGVNARAITLKINVGEIGLDVDTAIPCGLIINELVSNSLKYAFPPPWRDGAEGEICIELHSEPDNTLTLIVSDNGIGFPEEVDFRKLDSLGLQLVSTLTDQLGGAIELHRNGGTTFKISFAESKQKERG